MDEAEARGKVLSHVPQLEDDGLGPIRILLVAGSFGPTVTSTVLWLREFGIDIGCVAITARLLDGESAMITARQLLPLPLAEDYLVRKRRREQEDVERKRGVRGMNSIKVLAEAGLLEKGTTLRIGMDALISKWRPQVEEFLSSFPEAAFAEWTGEMTARSMRWRHDDEVYSATGLTKTLLAAAGVDVPEALPGPDYWLLPDGRPMYKASVAVRAQDD